MDYPDRTRIEVSNLQSGDIMMKGSDGSRTSGLIKVGQKLTHPFRDASIVHAGLLTLDKDTEGFEEFYVVEAQKEGLKRNKLLTDNASYGYIVFRAKNLQVRKSLANAAAFFISQQTANRNLPYSYREAISSLFTKHLGDVNLPDRFLNKIVEGESLPFYCSQFVTFSLLAVHQQIQQTDTLSPLNNEFFRDINKYIAFYRWQFILLFTCLIFDAAFDSVFRASLKFIIDATIIPQNYGLLVLILSLLVVGAILYTCIGLLGIFLGARLGILITNNIRRSLFQHLQSLSMEFFGRRSTGDIVKCLIADVQKVENRVITMGLTVVVLELCNLLFSTIFLFFINWQLALLSYIGLTICTIAPAKIASLATDAGYQLLQQEGQIANVVEENMLSQAVVKVFGLENRISKDFSIHLNNLDILSETPAVQDAPDAIDLPHFESDIYFDNVSFSYSQDRGGVKNLSLKIRQGDYAVFVGQSGAGKSTIVNLLTRFYDPDQGRILIDGIDLRHATVRSLRSQIGLVSQEVILFNCSVRENIRMGYLEATDEQVEAAAKAAEIHNFILTLPQGYDTPVGDRGGQLSGGQRQRVALARALVRNPAILILDEATSSLDPATEGEILATIERITKERTVIFITHRMAHALRADVMFVMDNGSLVVSG